MRNVATQSLHQFPVQASKVVRRAFVLAAVVCRGSIENGTGEIEAESLYLRISEWLNQLDVWDEAEPDEKRILRTPLGNLEQKDIIRSTWYVEGLAILAWALNQFEFPRHDQQVDSYSVAEAVWFLSEDALQWANTAILRDATELQACEELLYAIHTRLRDFIRNRERKNFTSWIEETWTKVLHLDASLLIVNSDLALGDKPVSEAEDESVQEFVHLTFERHRAINWLLGGYPVYSQTLVDT